MKKKAVLIISILLVICIGILSFSGCFLFRDPRNKTLNLTQLSQLVDGDIVFDIGNIDEIEDDDKIQYTLDGGKTWRDAKFNWNYNCYYCGVDESDYGKEFKIAIRIAEDYENRASRKSNRISYVVKAPNDFNSIITSELWDDNTSMEEYVGEYIFVFECNKIRLKRVYQQENGEIVLKAVEDKEKLEFEYKLIDKSVALKQTPDFIENGEWLRKYFDSEEEYLCALETIAYFWCYSEESSKPYDTENWIDYDYSKGILEEEYSDNTVTHLSEEDDGIALSGKLVILLVRIKESSSTLRSDTFLIIVPLQ